MSSDLHAVLGAGPAGAGVVDALIARGHRVRWVNRSAPERRTPGVEHVVADVTDVDQTARALSGATVAYHCVNVAYHLQVEVMPEVADAVLSACARTGTRLVVLDTLYPYGVPDGPITEETPWRTSSRKGRMRADLDRRYLAAHERGDVNVVMGRAADFFGPRVLNSTLGGATFPAALTGEPVLTFGDTALPHAFSFVPDVGAGLALLGEHPGDAGRVWHLPVNRARSVDEVLALVADAVGRPVTTHNLARAEAYGPFDAVFMGEYSEMFYQHTTVQDVVSAAFEERFGLRPTPLPDAIAATVQWYRSFLAQSG